MLSYGGVNVLFSCQRTSAEGEGFEPSRHLSASSALAVRRLGPLGQPSNGCITAEGERFELPWPKPPVFETGALPVRLTLRIRSRRWMSHCLMTSCTSSLSDTAGRSRTCTSIVLETIASAVGLLRRLVSSSASGRTRTCTSVHLKHAPLPIGLPKRRSAQWILEGFEPSSPGCKPSVLPIGRRTRYVFSVAGRIRTFIPGLRRAVLRPIELPQQNFFPVVQAGFEPATPRF